MGQDGFVLRPVVDAGKGRAELGVLADAAVENLHHARHALPAYEFGDIFHDWLYGGR